MQNSLADPQSLSSLQSPDTSHISCVETTTTESAVTSSTVCVAPSNNGPSVTTKTAAAKAKAAASKAKEIARLKRWESEQAAELEKFVETTCGCTLADGKPCSTLLPLQYYVDYRAQVFFLSREQLDMVLLGNVASNIREDDDVGTRNGHRPAKRIRTCMDYKHKGYMLCRKTFTFLHDMSHHKVQAMKDHFSENGLTVRTHGNSLKRPHNALMIV